MVKIHHICLCEEQSRSLHSNSWSLDIATKCIFFLYGSSENYWKFSSKVIFGCIMYQKNQKHDPNGHHLNKSYLRAAFNQSDTPRRKLSYYQYLANIFILPILGKYCKFYQYWEGLRRKAICRSQKLRQHILSIAFLSLLMSSAVRNCPWYMMFYLSRTSWWHSPPLSSCSSLQVSIIYGVLPKFQDDIVHLFPAACLPCNLGAATEVVATAGAWRGLLFRGIRGSGIFRVVWSGLIFFFLFFYSPHSWK